MAIEFARIEYLSRSKGGNACQSSAYISRDRIVFEGTKFQEGKIYNYSSRNKVAFEAVLLPEGVDKKFSNPTYLWNAVEKAENRKNSQTATITVLALPDNIEVSDLDRQRLVLEYAKENFTDLGLAVQVAIHKELSKDGKSFNIHAHFQGATRYFNKEGTELGEKARDLMPAIAKGFVVEKNLPGKKWRAKQNLYFEEHGIPVRVDPVGLIGEKHLGAVRLRSEIGASLVQENDLRKELNRIEANNPSAILINLTMNRSFFTTEDLFSFVSKHVHISVATEVIDEFWKQKGIVELLDSKTHNSAGKYTTQEVIEEEKLILRLSERIYGQNSLGIQSNESEKFTKNLTGEQKIAFQNIINGRGLSLVEGHAGTGKSYLLSSLQDVYMDSGYEVRSFGPDSATVSVLKEKGLVSSCTIHKFLFLNKKSKISINTGKEVWLVDEAGKISNKVMSEFLKAAETNKAKVVFCGSSAQLSSVERGGMFRVLSDKYGSETLQNIQRQKNNTQLKITRNLALGNINQAIGDIAHYGGAQFKGSKEAANKALLKQWIADRVSFPGASTIIIANSYKEVNKFNECVREQLKKEGIISEKEHLCKTIFGDIVMSIGDKIEFRQNNPEIGLINGASGVVTQISENEIAVNHRDEKNIQRTIKFNPQEYVHYNLPYAKTYSRVQGETYDRAYVSNTTYMSLQKFYVAGTRHRWKIFVFSSQKEAANVAELKMQVSKSEWQGSTLAYTTREQLKQDQKMIENETYLNDLKESSSVISRFKGKAYEAVGTIGSRIRQFRQATTDRSANESFYKFEKKDYKGLGSVTEIQATGTNYEIKIPDDSVGISKTDIEVLYKDLENLQAFTPHDFKPNNQTQVKLTWKDLPQENKALLRHYFNCVDKTDMLGLIVKQEKAALSPLLHEEEWKKSCGARNKAAYDLTQFIPQEGLKKSIGQKGIDIVMDRSARHAAYLAITKENKMDIEGELKQNLEPLLYKLFPDGPTQRTSKGLRFGSKGSLSVTLSGEYSGFYKDFEKGDKGGMIQLISKTLDCDRTGAIKWAKEFLGNSQSIEVPKNFKNNFAENKDNWISLKSDSNHTSPDLKQIAPSFLMKYKEEARYAYKAEDGGVLFYTVRFVDKEKPSEKIVLPLSYGKYQGDENPRWMIKGYRDGSKMPIYNLDQLQSNPKATILVVEGEKTADAAQKMYEKDDICCVTWIGGSKAASKSDWSPLIGREVIIWPDNDNAGFSASDDVCTELRKVGVASISVVDKNILAKDFPKKWDLADPLPTDKTEQNIKDLMLNGQNKAVSLESIFAMFKGDKTPEREFIDKLAINEILWRTDERLRPKLEEKFGSKDWEIKNAIKDETFNILNNRGKICEDLQKHHNIQPEMARKMEFCLMVHQAKTGDIPTEKEIKQLRELIVKFDSKTLESKTLPLNEFDGAKTAIISFATDKVLSNLYSFGSHHNISEEKFKSMSISLAQNINKKFDYDQKFESNSKQKTNQLEK